MKIMCPNAHQLWASLHRGNPGDLFLATSEKPKVGDTVPLEVGLPGKNRTLELPVPVVGKRGAGSRFPTGIIVHLTDAQSQACREYIGIGAVGTPAAPKRATGAPGDAVKPRKSVLVADDDSDILGFLERVLTRFSVDITTVADGASALKVIRENRPTLVLMDVVMPGMDGTDVCKAMREDGALAGVPVILLSALHKDELDALSDKAGANDCLAKPVDLAHLLNVVGAYLWD